MKDYFQGRSVEETDPAPLASIPWSMVLWAIALGIAMAIAGALLLAIISGRVPACC